jgi:transposase
MLKDLAGRFVVIWDGGPRHKGDPIRDLMGRFAGRLDLEKLPPYAPMLNPVESLWSWLRWERLSNLGPRDAADLNARVIKPVNGRQS